jgi:hypothetical protein
MRNPFRFTIQQLSIVFWIKVNVLHVLASLSAPPASYGPFSLTLTPNVPPPQDLCINSSLYPEVLPSIFA